MSDFHHNVSSRVFPLCRWTYVKLIACGKTNWGRDFPSALEDPAEAKNYVSAFYYALSPLLKEVSDRDEHIMRACSLLAILPPPPGTPARHLEIPMDLYAMRLPDWVNNVWDLATGMVMLPPTFLVTVKVVQSSVLPKLERVAGVKSCRFCLHLHTVCGCSQISAWSHTSTRQTPATVTTAGSHTSTSVSTSMMHHLQAYCLKELQLPLAPTLRLWHLAKLPRLV